MSNTFEFGGYKFTKNYFMKPPDVAKPESESYVSVPPALTITDREWNIMAGREGNVWTLGFQRPARDPHNTGEYEFDVVRNGVVMGEWACRIEYRAGRLRIFGHQGWRTWNGKTFI